ncbi:MAG TPA: antibiotic biosynthesis monooxygenase [Usitatibacter sp.]|nr:antibiotic biosynthesis monooxygenase [Usitatibacter sp.]
MVVTIFRNRLKPANVDEYYEWAARISALARTMPGYVSHKTFAAEDGERVTIVEFADEASQRGWSTEMRHVEAKKKGRADFYTEYKLQVCTVVRESNFTAE